MISLKKYLDSVPSDPATNHGESCGNLALIALASYSSAIISIGCCCIHACPALGIDLKENLNKLALNLSGVPTCETLADTDKEVQQQLQSWGRNTARHYQQKSDEVKELLITMARTAESVGVRDQRCAGRIHEVTARLTAIASLDNLTLIRASIEKSAAELKTSIDRMTEEGKAAIDHLQQQVEISKNCRHRGIEIGWNGMADFNRAIERTR